MPRKNKKKEIDYGYDSENSDVQHFIMLYMSNVERWTSSAHTSRQCHRYVRMIIVQTPMTTPIMMESRRRRDFIIDTRLLIPGMVPMNDIS